MLVAGYQQVDSLGKLDAEDLRKHFDINSIGPLLMTQALRSNLAGGSKVGDTTLLGGPAPGFNPGIVQTAWP